MNTLIELAKIHIKCARHRDHKLAVRQRLSHAYLAGDGLELGALHCPLDVSAKARVRYVDRASMDINVILFPDIPRENFVPIDIYDDGETLSQIPDGSQDFIIANHFLEHTKNPLGTVEAHLRKCKSGGVLFYAVPDKQFTFDRDRPLTPFQHVLADYLAPDPARDEAHYREYAEYIDGKTGAEIEPHARLLIETDNRLHFHVWNKRNILGLFIRAQRVLKIPYHIETGAWVDNEVIVILRKTGDAPRIRSL